MTESGELGGVGRRGAGFADRHQCSDPRQTAVIRSPFSVLRSPFSVIRYLPTSPQRGFFRMADLAERVAEMKQRLVELREFL